MSDYRDNYFHLILKLHAGADDTEADKSKYQKAEEVQAEQKETEKDTTTASSGKDATQETTAERNTFYLDVKVFLEGVQVPHSSCAISYGITSPPTATVVLPAASFMRDLPETTKLHVIFRDLVPDDSGVYQWRLLFDGELSGVTYSIDPTGANVSLSAIHTTAYLHSMQIITQAAAEYMLNKSPEMIGEFVMKTPFGMTQVKTKIIDTIINSRSYNSMADLVYLIMYVLLENYKDSSAVSKWYWGKLGNGAGGYKILQRIYGVSSTAKGGLSLGGRIDGSNTYSGSGGSSYSSSGYNSDVYIDGGIDPSQNIGNVKGDGGVWLSLYRFTDDSLFVGGTGKNSSVIVDQCKLWENKQPYGTPASNTCVRAVVDRWCAAGFQFPTCDGNCDHAIKEARNWGIWHDADGSYIGKAGDCIILGNSSGTSTNHAMMLDGKGGAWNIRTSNAYGYGTYTFAYDSSVSSVWGSHTSNSHTIAGIIAMSDSTRTS